MTDNDLEERADDVWSMDEVRSGDTERSEGAETSQTADTADTSDTSKTSDTVDTAGAADTDGTEATEETDGVQSIEGRTVREMAVDADNKGLSVRDLHNVNVYLYEDIYQEMMHRFKELDAMYFQEHGEDLSKNKDFFNAVFKAGLNSEQLEEELEL